MSRTAKSAACRTIARPQSLRVLQREPHRIPIEKKATTMAKKPRKKSDSTATIGFEAKLWLAADKLRNNMDAAEYKHVVLGLIFLKYISDSFDEHRAKLLAGEGDYAGADPEDPDEYKAENVFWVATFTAKGAPLYTQITANLNQSRTLATVRDTLLPKLLSGELSVTETAV